jgi:dienelactone hydrolase
MTKRIFLVFLTFLFAASAFAEPVPPATNKDGSVVSGFVTANFDPLNEQYPLPWNFLFLGTDDLTLNPPVDDPNDYSDPLVALSAIDGFSTTERWITTFSSFPNAINSSTVAAGQTVRFFEVSTVLGTIVIVNGIVRELTPGVDYMINLTETGVLAILPLKPLKEMTTYMAVITNDITDTAGNNATPSSTYHLSKAETPWIDENGNSTSPFFSDASAATLESLRRMTFSMETAAASVGIPREDIILSWTAQTQSITPVTKAVRSTARPAPTQVLPTGLNTSVLGAPGIADIYMGIITLPYYLGVPSAENPTAPLTDFWTAAPGAYVPPFDGFGLNPESTNVTIANPFPVKTSDQTVPLLLTVPNANSGKQKPAAGWPIVIFGHAVGQNRANLLPVADAFAAAGYAVIGIDSTLHGIAQDDPVLGLLNVENGPWADVANERTFNVDYINNETGAPGPDGIPDPSGAHVINLRSLLTSRDNARQAQADLSVLAVTLPTIDIDLDGLPDLDASTVRYAGMSLGGGIHGVAFTAIEPLVTSSFLSVPGGGIARMVEASPTFGPPIQAGLAALGIEKGTANYELFFTVTQTVVDSMDPINWIGEAARLKNVALHEVIGDTVIPNQVLTAPLSGTEPLIRTGGLTVYASTLVNPSGVDAAGRFVPPAVHSSLVDLTASPAATVEMQKQMVSFIASGGAAVQVEDASTMAPVPSPGSEADSGQEESP